MSFVRQVDDPATICKLDVDGVFLDFLDAPRTATLKEAVELGCNNNAIFSIQPGKLAIYFFHEGENFICER